MNSKINADLFISNKSGIHHSFSNVLAEEAQKILKKKYVSERKDHLSRLLQLHKLVPLRSVLSQIGRETVVLNSVPKHFEIIQPLLKASMRKEHKVFFLFLRGRRCVCVCVCDFFY